jgi:hypothetical protein
MAAVLLLNTAAQAQSSVVDQSPAILAGGSYRLITNVPRVTGGLSSAPYRLLPAVPTAGEGCCCKTILPCIMK